jgi:type IV secretion system protein VirB9
MKRVVIVIMCCIYSFAWAASSPKNMSTDSRIKTLAYHPDQVYEITTAFGIASTVEFEEGEEVVSAAFGDPAAWQFVALPRSFNIKPVMWEADTNLTVWTNKRLYLFNLRVTPPILNDMGEVQKYGDSRNLLFLLRFTYPNYSEKISFNSMDPENSSEISCKNKDYTRYGSRAIVPKFVCDDDQFTYFYFSPKQDRPAIFLVDEEGYEHVINTRQEGDYQVVERLGKQFSLRHGRRVASVFNEIPPAF